jgi:hypothetical protein
MRLGPLGALLLALAPFSSPTAALGTEIERPARLAYARLPITFEENVGQSGPEVDFISRGPGYLIEIRAGGAVVLGGSRQLTLRFVGGAIRARGMPMERHETISNYLVGASSGWQTGVRSYRRVMYREIYPGVDAAYYGSGGRLEYDLLVAAHADPGQIELAFDGADELQLGEDGDVVARLGAERLRFNKPVVYQTRLGKREPVAGRYVRTGPKRLRFAIESYDRERPLIIDPVVVYSTFLGGSLGERPYGMVVDKAGSAYIVGDTWSLNLSTKAALQPVNRGDRDVFVAKVSSDGSALIYCTYLGGRGYDSGRALTVDRDGAVLLTGVTYSEDFPTIMGAPQKTAQDHGDAFIAKISPAGDRLVYSTHIGGGGADAGSAIALDAIGRAYVAGSTSSVDFPVSRPYQSRFQGGFSDGFIVVLDPAGWLLSSTYLGGAGSDIATGIAVRSSGQAVIVGSTDSTNFPQVRAAQSAKGGNLDAFVAVLDPFTPSLTYASYLGGRSADMAAAVAVDPSDAVFIAGTTMSSDFLPAAPGKRRTPDYGYDSFAVKLSRDGAVQYVATLGGNGSDQANAIAVDATGRAYIGGQSYSSDLAVVDAIQESPGGAADGFLAVLDAAGASLAFCTFLGGGSDDQIVGIGVDDTGIPTVAGVTSSASFMTTPGAFQRSFGRGSDAFLTKIALGSATSPTLVINAGGPAIGTTTPPWSADTFYVGGSPYSNYGYVSGATEQAPYQTNRWGDFRYSIPLDNGAYDVTLKFAEVAPVLPGQRLFTVATNELTLLRRFDVVTAAGGLHRAVDATFPITVLNGMLTLRFIPEKANAMVSGIVVSRRAAARAVQIDAGSTTTVESPTGPWLPDSAYAGGGVYTTTATIAGTSTPAVYQSNRWGAFTYTIPAPNGLRTVTLKFAEIAPVYAGQRQFDVFINGAPVLRDFDVVATAGGLNIAVDRTFTVNVTNQKILIQLTPRRANPFLSGISIL